MLTRFRVGWPLSGRCLPCVVALSSSGWRRPCWRRSRRLRWRPHPSRRSNRRASERCWSTGRSLPSSVQVKGSLGAARGHAVQPASHPGSVKCAGNRVTQCNSGSRSATGRSSRPTGRSSRPTGRSSRPRQVCGWPGHSVQLWVAQCNRPVIPAPSSVQVTGRHNYNFHWIYLSVVWSRIDGRSAPRLVVPPPVFGPLFPVTDVGQTGRAAVDAVTASVRRSCLVASETSTVRPRSISFDDAPRSSPAPSSAGLRTHDSLLLARSSQLSCRVVSAAQSQEDVGAGRTTRVSFSQVSGRTGHAARWAQQQGPRQGGGICFPI